MGIIGRGLRAAGIAVPMIAGFEGLSLTPYDDVGGVSTVCYGDTDTQQQLTDETACNAALDVRTVDLGLRLAADLPKLPPEALAAVISFVYNIGLPAYYGSSVRKSLIAGRYHEAARMMGFWVNVRGKRVQGLVNRRRKEGDALINSFLKSDKK